VLAKAREETAAATYKAAQAEKEKAKQELDTKIQEAGTKARDASLYVGSFKTDVNRNIKDRVFSILDNSTSKLEELVLNSFRDDAGMTVESGGSVADALAINLQNFLDSDNVGKNTYGVLGALASAGTTVINGILGVDL